MPYMPEPGSGWVLELAHGSGSLQVDLLRAQYQTVAFDLSPYMGRLTARKLARHGLDASLVRGDALQLPFMTASILTLVCSFPTHFISEPDALTEIHRILSKDGQGIIVLAGQLRGGGLLRGFLESLYRITGQRDTPFSQARRREQFAQYGFHVKTIETLCKDSVVQLVILTKK